MSIYERKERSFQTKRNERKPSYYNEYIMNDEPPKRESYLWFLIFMTVVIFFPAIINIVFSYMDLDKCQEMQYITTLNIWLRFLGIYSIIYYTFIFLSIYFIYIRNTNENYSRMYNNHDRNEHETNQYFFKFFVTIFTIFMLIIQSLVTYSYFQYFNNHCTSYTIILYMWITLFLGFLSSIFIIFSVFFFRFE